MTSNFTITSFTEIELNSIGLDIHNNFDFVPNDIEISETLIGLHFKKSKGDWAIHTPYENLYFTLNNYRFLKHIEPEIQFSEDDFCLAGITFFDANFREENYSLMERRTPNETDDIIFSFESGRVIRVNCESVTLRIG